MRRLRRWWKIWKAWTHSWASLPTQTQQLCLQVRELQDQTAELASVLRELLVAIGYGPVQTPETPRLVPQESAPDLQGTQGEPTTLPIPLPNPTANRSPPDPHRLRTSRDVTYSSRASLRALDAEAEAARRPWQQTPRS